MTRVFAQTGSKKFSNEIGQNFLRAAKSGDAKKINDFLLNGVDINTTNYTGLTALHLAVKEGFIDVVKLLISNGADVNISSKKGNTALHIACLAGHRHVVQALLDANANVNCQSIVGFTPLYMAAQENHLEIVNLLLSKKANQSLTTEDGFTPLAVALQQGHDRIVAVLLERDTKSRGGLPALHIAARKDDLNAAILLLNNPDVNVNHQSQTGFTALHISAHYGTTSVGTMLIQRGADVNFQAKNNITPLHVGSKWGRLPMVILLIENGAQVDCRTRDGLSPLHCAARSGHNEVCSYLIDKGCNPSSKTRNGLTPLHMAAQGNHENVAQNLISRGASLQATTGDFLNPLHVAAHCGNVNVARLLLDQKCDMNARALNGFTPLHIACKKNKLAVVELLLAYGAHITCTTEAGLTPLHVAAFIGSSEIVTQLLEKGAPSDQATMRCETALHLAARNCQLEAAHTLLKNSANVNAQAKESQTPLHIAVLTGNLEMVNLILAAGADPNSTTRDAYTALHIAAKDGRIDIVQSLLDAEANVDARTKRGFSPLHLAAKRGRPAVARQLLQVKRTNVDAIGRNGLTPLHMATHFNHVQLVELLLDHGAEASRAAENGYTALHIAAKKNHHDIAALLLAHIRDNSKSTNAGSRCGFTPLHLAAQEGNFDMVSLLLLNGADPDQKAKNGLTAMHLAAQEDRVAVAQQLVSGGVKLSPVTNAGYTPLHTAAHFGRLNMVRYLLNLKEAPDMNQQTVMGFTPLHLASQQGHLEVVFLLLDNGANPDIKNLQGLTAAEMASRQHYITIFDTLSTVTTVCTSWESVEEIEEVLLDNPEFMGESGAVESEDEGTRSPLSPRRKDLHTITTLDQVPVVLDTVEVSTSSQPRTLTVPVDNEVIWDEMQYLSRPIDEPIQETNHLHNHIDLSASLSRDITLSETTPTLYGPGDHLDGAWEMEPETTMLSKKPLAGGFLVSFMVDARGGLLESKRYPGLRFIIPPNASVGPLRLICRFLRYPHYQIIPPLNDGEGLACRLMELGPINVRFNAPILIEIPYCASLKSQQREIIVLRSDNGETWKEHPLDASDQSVQDSLGEYFGDAVPLTELRNQRVYRILTNTIPQYFALVTRIRQDLMLIGPEGCVMTSTVVPSVQVTFPPGALQKKIRVGLQVQEIAPQLVAKCVGSRISVSPIVTIEPRRRKFHSPITIAIPFPAGLANGLNDHSDISSLRLLCSITGGTLPAVWEDITGSSPFTLQKDCVSFTTTVSARLWLIDCPNLSEVLEMATNLYNESISVPYFGKFVVYGRRHHQEEAQIRCMCLTDDNEQKTLECQEGYEILAKGEPVEILHDHEMWLETAGNLVPVSNSVDQLHLLMRAFEENRLNMLIRVKDLSLPACGKLAFMPQQRSPGGSDVDPLSVLNVTLPKIGSNLPLLSEIDQFLATENGLITETNESIKTEGCVESIARSDIDMQKVADLLGYDWILLAEHFGFSKHDRDIIASNHDCNADRAYACLLLWQAKQTKETTSGIVLARALREIGRDDVLKEAMQNIGLVLDNDELSTAFKFLNDDDSTSNSFNSVVVAKRIAAEEVVSEQNINEEVIPPPFNENGTMSENLQASIIQQNRMLGLQELGNIFDDSDLITAPSLKDEHSGIQEEELFYHKTITNESFVPSSMKIDDDEEGANTDSIQSSLEPEQPINSTS